MSCVNIEIKAKCFHPERVEAFLLSLGAVFTGTDFQKDTYFNVSHGRLKLRQGNIENNLICYIRPNQKGPKQSDYILTPVSDPPALELLLAQALGTRIIVEKRRKIFFLRNIKIHLDEVFGLGSFVEIEAGNQHNADIKIEELHEQCNWLMQELGIDEADLVENSYSDMLLKKPGSDGL